jgi:hypothetical protein
MTMLILPSQTLDSVLYLKPRGQRLSPAGGLAVAGPCAPGGPLGRGIQENDPN